jgi:hypothetical protein
MNDAVMDAEIEAPAAPADGPKKRGRPPLYTPEEAAQRERDRKRAARAKPADRPDAVQDAPVEAAPKKPAAKGGKAATGRLAAQLARMPGQALEMTLFGAELVPGKTVVIARNGAKCAVDVPAGIRQSRELLDSAISEACAEVEMTPAMVLGVAALVHAVNMGMLYTGCVRALRDAEAKAGPQDAPEAQAGPQEAPQAAPGPVNAGAFG